MAARPGYTGNSLLSKRQSKNCDHGKQNKIHITLVHAITQIYFLQCTLEQQLAWFANRGSWCDQSRPVKPRKRNGRTRNKQTYIEVPVFAAGFPIIILSDTPAILSVFPSAEASNKWSVVFSKEASMRTLSFILATPKRVIPRTSPYS